MTTEKYADLADVARTLGITNFSMTTTNGKVVIAGQTEFQLEKDLFWDAIKRHDGWQQDVTADIRAARTDVHGYHVVQPGDSLSKIAKVHLDNAARYPEIFEANRDQLKDPNVIHPGQRLLIPKR